jgi:tRNA 2-thiouridine synthesizing protein A
MQDVTPSDRVILWADDPMAQIDVPHFCSQNSYILDSIQAVDDMWVFEIRRAD